MDTINKRIFIATRYPVSTQHGRPPIAFLEQLVDTLNAFNGSHGKRGNRGVSGVI